MLIDLGGSNRIEMCVNDANGLFVRGTVHVHTYVQTNARKPTPSTFPLSRARRQAALARRKVPAEHHAIARLAEFGDGLS